jgi:hypothetical protein
VFINVVRYPNRLLAERNMNLTAMSMFTFYMLYRVYELSMENVRYGEIALAQKGVDVSRYSAPHRKLPGKCSIS